MTGLIAWMALSACGRIKDVAYEDGEIPGVGTVSWATHRAGRAHAEFGTDAHHLDQRSAVVDASAGRVPVVGLQTATQYFFRVAVEDRGKSEESDVVEALTQPPPRDTPPLFLDTWNPDLACEDGGYVLFNYLGEHESGVVITDREANYVWAIASEDPTVQIARTRLGRDGHSILWNTDDYDRQDDIATIERRSIDGTTSTSTRTLNAHHDFVELPDGDMAWIAYSFADPPLALAPDFPPPWTQFPTAYDRVYEAPEGIGAADDPTLVFDQVRDWPDGLYFNDRSESIEKCDTGFLPGYCEMGHGNSLAYIDAVDQFQLGFRWLDATVRLDRSGAVQWVFGGPLNEFAGNADDLPVHFHYSDAWADGMMVFDNHDPDPSRLMGYAFDTAAKTFSVTFTAREDQNEGLLGDVRRIPIDGCDNLLVALTAEGALEEITSDGKLVWKVYYGVGDGIGRAQYLSSVSDFAEQASWQ